jgi:hypothetical protein
VQKLQNTTFLLYHTAKYLASNPTPDHVKKRLQLQGDGKSIESSVVKSDTANIATSKRTVENLDLSFDDESLSVTDESISKQPETKRARKHKPFFTTSEEVNKLIDTEPNNPFVQLVNNEHLYYRIILLMTLEAENKEPKKQDESYEPVSKTITEGFYWRDYPELESLLYRNMDSYYSVSVTNRQSRVQQNFNNHMVSTIRQTAQAAGYSFDPSFSDKRLRDRIRCFYKTHLQNAKKRLATMQKHPTSALNQTQLRLWIDEVQQQMKTGPLSHFKNEDNRSDRQDDGSRSAKSFFSLGE